MIEITVRLHAPNGGFQPTTFGEWIGHQVQITGLDQAHRHVLTAVDNSPDGRVSTLTVCTTNGDEAGPDLTANMSVIMGTPKAQVRAHDDAGAHLTTAHLDAPLSEGQTVTIDGVPHTVRAVRYPYRDPADAETVEDYQHVTVQPIPATEIVQDLGFVGIPGGGFGVAAMLGLMQ